jgi:hypothetical protein
VHKNSALEVTLSFMGGTHIHPWNSFLHLILIFFSSRSIPAHHHVILGRRRLEICSIGNRSFIFMDIRHRLCGWHMPNYTPSAITLRHNQSDRYSIFEDCQEEA